jgi:hypothetical protein
MTSGSMTFNPKPTTRHVYRISDLFGQVHLERSIKTLFWYLEPLLLHQPPNLIVPKKKRTRTACTCKISAWRNNDVRLPVSILSTVIWHVNSERNLELWLLKKRLKTKSTDCLNHGLRLSPADWKRRHVQNKFEILTRPDGAPSGIGILILMKSYPGIRCLSISVRDPMTELWSSSVSRTSSLSCIYKTILSDLVSFL